ncbi:MAG: M20/M25/M40 family metallo-hydrolase [Blastocatellia bacterium]|nr:M20/M25/M40 family metallo-hydrolase [Blastocatellia bacterium]
MSLTHLGSRMHRFIFSLFAVLALVIGGGLWAPWILGGDPKGGGSAAITAEEIRAHVRFLASDELEGREAGTEGAERAARYIASAFRAYGLKPVGENGTFEQRFSFVARVVPGPMSRLRMKVGAAERDFTLGKDFVPLALSSPGAAEGEVIFAGYGISAPELNYDDYAGIESSGKIILVLSGSPDGQDPHGRFQAHRAPQRKIATAREKGARGVLFLAVEEKAEDDRLATLRYDPMFGEAGIPVLLLGRAAASEILRAAGKDLVELERALTATAAARSIPLPGIRLAISADVKKEMRQTANVVGMVEGSDPALKDEIIIIGAHYDHLGRGGERSLAPHQTGEVHNGADDNASGVAGLLELAQALASVRASLRRSILFIAFSAEEMGLLGSNHYVKHPLFPLERTIAMFNFDMIGRLRESGVTIYGVGTSPFWQTALERANERVRLAVRVRDDGVGPSDHTSFYLKDIPVLHFFTGVHEDYHKPSDDAEKINAEGVQRIVSLAYEVVRELDRQPTRPAFVRTREERREAIASGFRVYIGTIPDYAESAEGVKVAGVRPGSPAEKAGMRTGDVILRVGQREIRNVYDYTYALQELKEGVEVEFVILRDGERLSLKIIPERRRAF